ncbi:MAG: DUF2225 domain-containing protein [Thermobacillus sp.]|uniref:DUF2225 domain-containing protein n=1 Tax=Thermobacillus composti (strain DSM 18247 / JCM 13945 / KWC4) TaxID=717605 RepID=L0EAQ8_THECK|nr:MULTISPECIES: DUF2225 domain-containing protein [Thermobacillus]AGA56786.1 hypothetical protein Theco_0576 [Thermobacillus composti KWC4]REK53605.1 MAG: DUF2225 domain-containing protein [Thermobacillus sp.]
MIDPLFQVKVQCPCCENTFSSSRVRPSFRKVTRTDSDFCSHYRDEVNPDFYVVRVCPNCGYASTENSLQELTPRQKELYKNRIGKSWVRRDYGGQRTWEEALDCYKLALLCAQTVGDKDRVIAGLLHHIAWMYRLRDNQEQERRFLRYALEAYIRVYELEGVNIDNARLMYLIGELYRRLDEPYEAVRWFSRVVNDKRIMDAGMIKASREAWQNIRQEMLEKKMELPDEVELL